MDSTLEASWLFVDLCPCSTEENIFNPDGNFTSPRRLAGLIPWGSIVALAVVPPVHDANFCSPFQAAIVENQICRLDYLSWPSLTTVYAYPVTPKVIFFKIFER